MSFVVCTFHHLDLLAWCIKSENVHCVLLGASTAEQLHENLNSLHVKLFFDVFFFFIYFLNRLFQN